MSGICGQVNYTCKPVKDEAIGKMLDALKHRGPDSINSMRFGQVGFGNLLLKTTPESLHEKLPVHDSIADVTLVADARLDNRAVLISLLDLSPQQSSHIISDSQLILAGYLKWKEKCVDHFIGDFSFAIWDGQEKKLFCAVDHMGVRPFFYAHDSQAFYFASEIRALNVVINNSPVINEKAIAEKLSFVPICQPEETFYQHRYRLPSGSFLLVCNGQIKVNSYWTLETYAFKEIYYKNQSDYTDHYRELFDSAVQCRLRTVSPVGVRLSGGLDSASITVVAQQLIDPKVPLHTFTAYFDQEGDTDERQYVTDLFKASKLKAHSHFIDGNRINPLELLKQMLNYHDEPIFNLFSFVDWQINQQAFSTGTQVMLDGVDADATVAPIGIREALFIELIRNGRWLEVYSQLVGACRATGTSGLKYFISHAFIPFLTQFRIFPFRSTSFFHKEVLNKHFADVMDIERVLNDQGGYYWYPRNTVRESHFLQATYRYRDRIEMMNRLSNPFQIENRHPFADKRLLEYCLGLPAEQKFHHGLYRPVMRNALKYDLPQSILLRATKGGLRAHYAKPLFNSFERYFSEASFKYEHYLDVESIKKQLAASQDISSVQLNPMIILFALWFDEGFFRQVLSGLANNED